MGGEENKGCLHMQMVTKSRSFCISGAHASTLWRWTRKSEDAPQTWFGAAGRADDLQGTSPASPPSVPPSRVSSPPQLCRFSSPARRVSPLLPPEQNGTSDEHPAPRRK